MLEDQDYTRSGLLEKLASEDCGATKDQLESVERLADYFAKRGLIDGDRALPLHEACPVANDCWRHLGADERPEPAEAAASIPWVGSGYASARVCAIAMNFNNYGGLGAQWWVRRGDIHERLMRGRRPPFAFGLGQYLALALASLRRDSPAAGDFDPAACAEALESSGLLEAVLCAPKTKVSKPTAEMWRNCPPRYLVGQLDILRPSVVLAVGKDDVWQPVKEGLQVRMSEENGAFGRGVGKVTGEEVAVLFLNHPSRAFHRRRSQLLLRESLSARPLGT